jgi:hypothetical protein
MPVALTKAVGFPFENMLKFVVPTVADVEIALLVPGKGVNTKPSAPWAPTVPWVPSKPCEPTVP